MKTSLTEPRLVSTKTAIDRFFCAVLCLFMGHLTAIAGSRTEPATIRVLRTSSGQVQVVPFTDYVRGVLPNEWPAGYGWPAEAYKAGAESVKMYAWKQIENRAGSSYDVRDDTGDQVYNPNNISSNTDSAVQATRGIGMETTGGQLFLAQYWDGACDVIAGGANLRGSPSTSGNLITVLAAATRVYVIDNGENVANGHRWFQVAVHGVYPTSTTFVGYVASDLLTGVSIGSNSVASMEGRESQYGTVYWANQGWTYQQIQSYFYNGSTVTGFQNVSYFAVSISQNQNVTVSNIGANPASRQAGQQTTLSWSINSPVAQNVLLGASIVPSGTGTPYYNDSGNDKAQSLSAGSQSVSRPFVVPAGTPAGTYDIVVAAWADTNGNGVIDSGSDTQLGSATLSNAFTVAAPVTTITGVTPNPASGASATVGQNLAVSVDVGAEVASAGVLQVTIFDTVQRQDWVYIAGPQSVFHTFNPSALTSTTAGQKTYTIEARFRPGATSGPLTTSAANDVNSSLTYAVNWTTPTGALTVSLAPSGAVSAGAQWQVDGGNFQSDGATVSGLTAGNHTVTFRTVSGWTTPGSQTASIIAGQTTSLTGTYAVQVGSLTVNLGPSGAVSAGAQWQVDGGNFQGNGATVNGLSTGTHTVTFKTVSGWTTPASQTATIAANQTTTLTGTYVVVPQTGSLTVNLGPSGAVNAGAQWQVDSGAFQSDGMTVSGLSTGTHTVTFKTVSGWTTPASQTATITANQTTTLTGTYVVVPQTGSLTVNLGPSGAVNAGAQWQVDSGAFQSDGVTVSGLSTGTHTVTFKTVSGWTTPASQTATITANQTTTLTGTYGVVPQTGSLTVNLGPSGAVNAGAQWQVDSGVFQSDGMTVSGLSTGTHTLTFKTVSGWTTPASQTATIAANQTTTLTGTYVVVPQTGSLTVNLGPSGAVNAGAQWQVDSGAFQSDGVTVSGLSTGTHTVTFKTVSGWTTPASQTATIAANQTTTLTGTYVVVPQTGSLTVNLGPSGAVNAGAQWQVDSGVFQSDGVTVSGLSTGTHTVTFKTVSGWTTPASQTATIAIGQTTTLTGTYVVADGFLQVTLAPQGAIDAGAQWQVDGGAYQNSGATAGPVSAGNHTVTFKPTAGWITPASQTVLLAGGQTASATGTYAPLPTYTVTPSAGANGLIRPGLSKVVNQGDSVSFAAAPDPGFVVDQWLLNGNSAQVGGSSFNLANIASDEAIQVTFKVAQVNLAPYRPAGWSDRIVVSRNASASNGAAQDSTFLSSAEPLYLSWAMTNTASDPTSAQFTVELDIDGTFAHSWAQDPPMAGGTQRSVQNYPLGMLSPGTHVFKIKLDSGGALQETNEADNEYTKTVEVAAPLVMSNATYTGLLNGDFATHGYGQVTLQTTATGNLTGKVLADGLVFPFTGKLSSFGVFTKTLTAMSGTTVLARRTISLQVQNDGTFAGSWSSTVGASYTIAGEINATGTLQQPVAQLGKYSAHLRGEDITAGGGSVRGYLLATVGVTGATVFVGSLPDGTALSGATRISNSGRLPIAFGLYQSKRGYLFGSATLTAGGAFGGDLRWAKTPQATGIYASGVFDAAVELAGHSWTPPGPGARLVPDFDAQGGNMLVSLAGGELARDMLKLTNLTPANVVVVTPVTAEKLTLVVSKTTGAFTGSFVHTDGRLRAIKGAFVQDPAGASVVEGYFLGRTVPGLVKISVPPL